MEFGISPEPPLRLSTISAVSPSLRDLRRLTSKVTGIKTNASVPPPLSKSIRGGEAILGSQSGFDRFLVDMDVSLVMIL